MYPDLIYLVSAPVSFPFIGLAQLTHYCVACKTLAREPGELREGLSSTTAYCQGIVTAAVTASALIGFDSTVSHPTPAPSFSGSVTVPSKHIPSLH